jgi:hypothetical protein
VLVYIFCDFFDFGSLSLRTEKASSWNFGKTKSKFLTETEKTLNMKTVFDYKRFIIMTKVMNWKDHKRCKRGIRTKWKLGGVGRSKEKLGWRT